MHTEIALAFLSKYIEGILNECDDESKIVTAVPD